MAIDQLDDQGELKNEELTAEQVLDAFRDSVEYHTKWIEEAKKDIDFVLGKQWEDSDLQTLKESGRPALTINKIKPNIRLLMGMESQNRTDFAAFPEGQEDEVKAEIATRLLKNLMKQCDGDMKVSDAFEVALDTGTGYIEPYIDYTDDIVNGKMKLKARSPMSVFPEPGYQEYDLSDAKYICVFTSGLTRDEVKELYPDQLDKIGAMTSGTISLDGSGVLSAASSEILVRRRKYQNGTALPGTVDADLFDLVEYYYKKYVPKTWIADPATGQLVEAKDRLTAASVVNAITQVNAAAGQIGKPNPVSITRFVPEIWRASVVGGQMMEHGRLWTYPKWKSYPLIPFHCYRFPIRATNPELEIQGIPRGMRDLNFELNKRRSQELHHLNTSANSGWISEEGAWVDDDAVSKFGSAPGVNLKYRKGFQKPERITPTPLSQGHSQLAAEAAQDMKEESGINTDLLAMNESQASGRAISLRQRQGMVMVQKVFDNLAFSKRILGRFLMSQLGEVFDVESALRVLGNAFISENFLGQPQPVGVDPNTGQVVMAPPQVDLNAASQVVAEILTDTQMGVYDVTVGESASNETIKYSNFLTLQEMAKSGIPIPPEVLIEESSLSTASKEKIKAAIQQQQQAMVPPPPPGAGAKPPSR